MGQVQEVKTRGLFLKSERVFRGPSALCLKYEYAAMLARGTPHVAAGGRAASATSSSVHVLCTPLPARRPTSRGTHQQISPHILNMYLQPFFATWLSDKRYLISWLSDARWGR